MMRGVLFALAIFGGFFGLVYAGALAANAPGVVAVALFGLALCAIGKEMR